MADVIRRNPFGTEERHFGTEERHRADEIHIHHRPQKRSWWPYALLGLLAVGLLAIWSYARRHRPVVEARAPVEKIAPAIPAPPPVEEPPAPKAPIAAPPAEEPEATSPESGAMAEETEPGAAAAGGCSQEFLFAVNETALNAENKRMLASFADCLKANPSESVVLEGRADPRGSAEYNEGLARGRAQSVADGLSALGVSSDSVTTGIGDQLCSEATETCWQKNRSVIATSKR